MQNKCIYLKRDDINDGLTFNKKEHVIPAALGGINTLPKGYVSDKINEFFSKELEQPFMHNTSISMLRSFNGPGHRGSLSENKEAKSKISIITSKDNSEVLELGYIKKSKPYSLPNVLLSKYADSDELVLNFRLPVDNPLQQLEIFKDFPDNYSNKKYTLINSNKIRKSDILIGFELYKDKGKGKEKIRWYIAINSDSIIDNAIVNKFIDNLDYIIESYTNNYINGKVFNFKPEFNFHYEFNFDTYYRVYAKVAFNFMAYYFGAEFALLDCFDPIREWIILGGENSFVTMPDNNEHSSFAEIPLLNDIIDDKDHCIFIGIFNSELYSLVSFYGEQPRKVILCNDVSKYIHKTINFKTNMLICNWENREEYTLLDRILKYKL